MAMMDDVQFLISHIRNSFITSDDTGMCEMIIDTEEQDKLDKRLALNQSDSGMESSDNELSHSYDILPDMDFGAHRRRSNTSQRLERLKKEKRNQTKMKQISWKDTNTDFTEEKGLLFEKKRLPSPDRFDGEEPLISCLSEQINSSSSMGDNPFIEYAKFDGKASVGVATKRIDIFLTMATEEDRSYPMTIVCVSTARIQDLVGLICWQYTNEMRDPPLNENTEMYCLHIAEDDGEVDMDFPSLDSREPVSKFGFTKLALVEKDVPASSHKSVIIVTVNVPNRGFNKFQVENMSVTMKDILAKVLKRRKIRIRPGLAYNLEKQGEEDVSLDLDATLGSVDTLEFCLVRENSSRGVSFNLEASKTSDVEDVVMSHQYRSYIVSMVHKIRTNTDVQLGVSGDKVEIDPVVGKSSTRLFRQRAVTYDAENVVSCEILEEKNTGKSVFRLTYLSGHDYKHHDFEAESEKCKEIVNKILNILEFRFSPARKEFHAYRDKKLRKRDSLVK